MQESKEKIAEVFLKFIAFNSLQAEKMKKSYRKKCVIICVAFWAIILIGIIVSLSAFFASGGDDSG